MASRKPTEDVDLPALLKAIRLDSKYKVFKKIVEEAEQKLTIEKDRQEVFASHAARTSRKLYTGKKYNPSTIMDASANDLQARSRIVEIRMKAARHIEIIEKAMEAISDHVISEYHGEMRKYSNEAQRKAVIRRVQKVAKDLITDGKSLLDLCDAVVKDIDAGSFHLSHISNLAQQLHDIKKTRVV
jgi:hypothetical protein